MMTVSYKHALFVHYGLQWLKCIMHNHLTLRLNMTIETANQIRDMELKGQDQSM